MMTAIAVSYTTEGFALLADGRARRDDGFIVTDRAQKIFPVEGNSHLAFILAGNLVLGALGTNRVLVDFSATIREAVASRQSPVASGPVRDFAQSVCEYVLERFGEAQAATPFSLCGELDPVARTRTITRLFFLGYGCTGEHQAVPAGGRSCACLPAWVNARFFDQGDDELRYALEVIDVRSPRDMPMMYGSEVLAGLFAIDDPRVAKYRMPIFSLRPARRESVDESATTQISSLPDPDRLEATALAAVWGTGGRPSENSVSLSLGAGYIAACCDPELAQLDPERCAGIGGEIQVATITPEEGFVWRQKPSSGQPPVASRRSK